METLKRLFEDRDGATVVEYGLLAALISVGLLIGLQNFSSALLDMLTFITGTLEAAWA
ncbi:Flp family type IVb pilin [Sinorhizobium medicae]|uniref:Flp family type IVb pilin n=2 Tax=Sinorhizobium medicae TaxID=110321 RepID=A0A508WWH5_9HYPH|nr:Flp family type IVb pilin [Sinorhizobium medicae]ABR61342.1 Flp/Fap pilin component [Sinorhizobium medicae WSM419]MBO1943285.1 Flp family type IVb pilin [Sinorhizobium medicae]MBO1958955.1 Flp family type IVb pilin [Sinorhizobium medicae]MDX0405066.1 Flp family type IVb pilin [Sinorhizobium medicae]MDX0410949.1 Flp family type IVb pilin [Sinorhizobium medicae]